MEQQIDEATKNKTYDVGLIRITSLDMWHCTSWKGFAEKSGGVVTNIDVYVYYM